jgi:hypothetical protein
METNWIGGPRVRADRIARVRPVRRLLLGALAASFLLLLAGLAATPANAAPLPPQGIFESCPLASEMQTCLSRLEVIHEGGFQVVVIGAAGSSPAQLATYAAAAQGLGMSVMWALSDTGWWDQPATSTQMAGTFPSFAAACRCTQNGPLLGYLVRWLASLPATYGYYAADDSALAPGDHARVAAYVAEIKQQDPAHTLMIGSADAGQSRTYANVADVIGTEIYPITTSSQLSAKSGPWTWDSVAHSATDAQRLADGAHAQSAFILQAFTWGDNIDDGVAIGACSPGESKWSCNSGLRYPSGLAQTELRNEVLRHAHPRLILWWSFQGTYGQAGTDTYSIYPTGAEAASRWSGLTAAVNAPAPRLTAQLRRLRARIASKHHASRRATRLGRHRAAIT